MKGGSSPNKGIAQPYQRDVNVDYEKSLGNCLCDGINIYIMMAHNIKILFSFTWNSWWQNIGEL